MQSLTPSSRDKIIKEIENIRKSQELMMHARQLKDFEKESKDIAERERRGKKNAQKGMARKRAK